MRYEITMTSGQLEDTRIARQANQSPCARQHHDRPAQPSKTAEDVHLNDFVCFPMIIAGVDVELPVSASPCSTSLSQSASNESRTQEDHELSRELQRLTASVSGLADEAWKSVTEAMRVSLRGVCEEVLRRTGQHDDFWTEADQDFRLAIDEDARLLD